MNELQNLARVRDEDLAGQASGAGARALLAAITAEEPTPERAPVPRRRTRRLLLSAAATATLAAAALIGPSLVTTPAVATSYASTELDITREGGDWVARIKDPYADHKKYTEGFKAVGLNVQLQIVPVSPSGVGEMFQMGMGGSAIGQRMYTGTEPDGCETGRPGCVLVIKLPVGFNAQAWVKFGREARPGEAYQNSGRANAKGEMLEGVKVSGRTVGEVVAEARARGVKAIFQVITPNENYDGFSVKPGEAWPQVGNDWFVWDAESARPGVVRLLVTKEHLPKNPVYGDGEPPVG
ncbi:hypothetical protein [Nonomuraea sp. NPDC049695]|uniref:hypothetical protein n=1 Tax=Nonomuraea sp. NPDC049695 TaxID=3154734 RepID=UPI00342F1494